MSSQSQNIFVNGAGDDYAKSYILRAMIEIVAWITHSARVHIWYKYKPILGYLRYLGHEFFLN